MTKYYKVASHVFGLILPDSEKLKSALLEAYSPFEISSEDSDAAAPLFTLSLSDVLPEGDRKCVYDLPTEDGETVVRLYRQSSEGQPDSWYFETTPDHRLPVSARIWASGDFSRGLIQLSTRLVKDALFGINNAAMLLFAFASAFHGTLEMHASVIEKGGRAYLFLGKSGTGKSTHSRLWLENIPGCTLMNDDNPAVRVWPDGRIICYGTPWSGKTHCYKNMEAPVGAFLQLRQWPENKIRKQSVLEAFTSLYSSISGMKDDNTPMADALNGTLDKVISTIPCYHLDCLPDAAAARLSYDTLAR